MASTLAGGGTYRYVLLHLGFITVTKRSLSLAVSGGEARQAFACSEGP